MLIVVMKSEDVNGTCINLCEAPIQKIKNYIYRTSDDIVHRCV